MTGKEFLIAVTNSQIDLVQVLLNILAETGSPYCIADGFAANAYAEPVVSLDLDIIVAAANVEKVSEVAGKHGLKIEKYPHSINLSSAKSDLRIQLQMDERYQAFIPRAREKKVLGYQMKVAAIEDVLQGKIWAYQDEQRRKSKRQKDLADILRLVEARPELKSTLPPSIRVQAE